MQPGERAFPPARESGATQVERVVEAHIDVDGGGAVERNGRRDLDLLDGNSGRINEMHLAIEPAIERESLRSEGERSRSRELSQSTVSATVSFGCLIAP